MRGYPYHSLSAIKKVESGDDAIKENDDDEKDGKKCKNESFHHRHLPLQILEAEEMLQHIYPHYPSFQPFSTYSPLPMYPYPPPYPTVPVMMPVPIKTETTEFTFQPKQEQGKQEKHDEDDDNQEHHGDKHEDEDGDHHGLMTNTTFLLPCCQCKIVKTTTHTYSYNYLHSRKEGRKEMAGGDSKKMVGNKRNIVYQKKQ